MKVLIKKVLKGSLESGDWDALIKYSVGVYYAGSFGLLLLVIRNIALQNILIPLVVFSPFWFSLFLVKSFRQSLVRDTKWKTRGCVLVAVIGGVFVSGGGMGYIDFANALTSGKDVHLAAGTIEKLEPRRRSAPRVYIFDGQSTIPNIPITDEEYATLRPGDYYVSNLRLGGLGYYYRWRIDSWNRGWEARGMVTKQDASSSAKK
ncbi:hypothetical protein PQR67_25450 [Paraburkholderia fungorum]|uniref:hypothetical protein n=1 Tax=Paraburkholderia fungorum TaxID=134537 RepID=UPI0038B99F90